MVARQSSSHSSSSSALASAPLASRLACEACSSSRVRVRVRVRLTLTLTLTLILLLLLRGLQREAHPAHRDRALVLRAAAGACLLPAAPPAARRARGRLAIAPLHPPRQAHGRHLRRRARAAARLLLLHALAAARDALATQAHPLLERSDEVDRLGGLLGLGLAHLLDDALRNLAADTREMWGRYAADMGEMWGRCAGDMGEVWRGRAAKS